jgi:hypothetical protein
MKTRGKIMEGQEDFQAKKNLLQHEKTQMKSEEQEVAILLHKKDVGQEINTKVDGEMKYFKDLVDENKTKLDYLLREEGMLKGFIKLAEYLQDEGEIEKIPLDLKNLNDKVFLKGTSEKLVSKFRKMHLQISNLSDLFKDQQSRIKQKKKEFDEISKKLENKEKLLEKVVQPDNDFKTIVRSFVEEHSKKEEPRQPEEIQKKVQELKEEPNSSDQLRLSYIRFPESRNNVEERNYKEVIASNRRLLEMVSLNCSSINDVVH